MGQGHKNRILSDLLRLGVVAENDGIFSPCDHAAARSLELFAPLLDGFDVRLVPVHMPGCPIKFCSGILKLTERSAPDLQNRVGSFPAGGQGKTFKDAAIGCIGEMSERLSLCSLGADDLRVRDSGWAYPEIDFGSLAGFSPAQVATLIVKNTDLAKIADQQSIDWENISNRRIFVRNLLDENYAQMPAFGALFEEGFQKGRGISGLVSTVGAAVWPDLDGARERALLELIERDAVAQAWYNRLGITLLSEAMIAEKISVELRNFFKKRPRTSVLTIVETDLPVHVVVALSYMGEGAMTAFGASARFDFASALHGAVHEMLQAEYSLDLMAKAYPANGATDERQVPSILRYGRSGSIIEDWPGEPINETAAARLGEVYSYESLIEALQSKNITIWEFDATRQDLQIPCVKLFSPELCTWQPRFGKERLFKGVVERGLRSEPASEEEFAARPFPF